MNHAHAGAIQHGAVTTCTGGDQQDEQAITDDRFARLSVAHAPAASDVWGWIQREILAETGSIHNEDHAHLIDANIGVRWESSGFTKKGRVVLGQAEQVIFRAGG